MESIDEEMKARIEAARRSLAGEGDDGATFDDEKVRTVDELRAILKKFRRAMAAEGYPGTIMAQGKTTTGWIIASGEVEGFGKEIFHVFMLISGPIYYFSGDPFPPFEFTGKWILGDSIPVLESKIPANVAYIMAKYNVEWPKSPTF